MSRAMAFVKYPEALAAPAHGALTVRAAFAILQRPAEVAELADALA